VGKGLGKLPTNLLNELLPVLTDLVIKFEDGCRPERAFLKSLGALASCPRLTSLHLRAELDELPALPPQLEDLFFHSQVAKQVSSIASLTNLRDLTLCDCEGLADLTVVQGCTQLTALSIYSCFSVTAWPDLAALKTLSELHLSGWNTPQDWSYLTALTALTCLDFDGFDSFADLEVITSLTQLRDLSLTYVWKADDDEEEEEVDWDFWRWRLTSTLSRLVGLTQLNIQGAQVKNLEWCSALTNLTCLLAAVNLFESLASLNCPSLVELNLYGNLHLKTLEGLRGCPNLSKLFLTNCSLVSSLEPLCLWPSLTDLNLEGCTRISSLEPLSRCDRLAKLHLKGCKSALQGLEVLRELPNLKITGL
jgi:Leucine-rich repeat (LRR) protein